MNIWILDGLPYTTVTLTHQGIQCTIEHVLIDTGSGGTVFSTDRLLSLGIRYEMNAVIDLVQFHISCT